MSRYSTAFYVPLVSGLFLKVVSNFENFVEKKRPLTSGAKKAVILEQSCFVKKRPLISGAKKAVEFREDRDLRKKAVNMGDTKGR